VGDIKFWAINWKFNYFTKVDLEGKTFGSKLAHVALVQMKFNSSFETKCKYYF